ncbi:DEHA2F05434p [Debaryomyces hansenii CBS767]|jgi:mRNA (guanine-N7-)-methyltransferase|uniref:mRNA cap guanine-N(7) methyltransferase n=1 Tax=Debaryomyces hansenii (strain ATCC 36239 / CBS 767 / BCRC 21394 / JCM 1990 / NBRC 0083 / IGC 2968) TaxID=284592 RepID=MCES_DEBHA|nr:DEHA2F05434p [Debaryomyces hansenii CBS767]Q6BMH4.2 RecName: Full=mRNA cap guanine-N7 methyltransferase; AltName: Full=mRNA (guanine-N(7))-methyltransferase; AltName: Full=mRNA cap methyltransferase [Debaryomyces hansenii CBS767]CAG88922.2 DEHA2F05434p [Debaryomyces hansenii CBS767]|eukprot:XP_460598.2 DEHA2F05434p [Debaryomyces hansenii CBS767]
MSDKEAGVASSLGSNSPINKDEVDVKNTEEHSKQESKSDINKPPLKKIKADDGIDISDSFSRRENKGNNKVISSVYNDENKKTPAWMKSKTTDKYDKYGSRSTPIATPTAPVNNPDERYSKYMTNSVNSNDRVRRPPTETTSSQYDKKRAHDEAEDDVVAPYSNLAVANPSSNLYQTFQSHINNREGKDINSIVRSHYNQRTQQSKFQGSRTKSPIYKLRNFNNAIKYILLGNWVKPNPDSNRPTVILDLCCGKGGDLNKCEFVSVDQYIGIDISDASIKEAFSRYSRNKARFIPQTAESKKERDTRRYNFEACFATGDCFSSSIPEILEPNFPGIIDGLFPVDCVSLQFAMHYAFETEEKVHQLLTNVTKSLRAGGTLIGTIPSSDFIRDKIVNRAFIDQENRKFGNDLYSVTFHKDPPDEGVFRPPFGNGYNYSLKDAIDDVPEYVVPFEVFRGLCEEYGLVLKYKKNFIDIFNQEIPKYFSKLNKNLIEGMKRSDGKYGAEGLEKEAVGFYIGFVFEKLGN